MPHPSPAKAIAAALADALGGSWAVRPLQASSFCATWRAESAHDACFVKAAGGAEADALRAEADGLAALAATGCIRVPAVRALIDPAPDGSTLLALQWLALQPPDAGFGARFGAALGALHTAAVRPAFGWERDNRLGGTPQDNRAVDPPLDWVAFFNQRRLQPLLDRLAARGARTALIDAGYAVIARWGALAPANPRPSLIHGDLWSGNWGMLADGSPVIFDPAVSRSHAEAELAMMELFGSPPAGFWPEYAAAAGLDAAGYARRRPVYQLYHLLNHALLFAGGYEAQALACAQRLLRTL